MNQPLPHRGKLYTGWGNWSGRAERSQRLQLLSGLAAVGRIARLTSKSPSLFIPWPEQESHQEVELGLNFRGLSGVL